MGMEELVRRGMQERNLNYLKINNGFQFTDTFFPYTSGQIGPYYVQSGVVQNNPKHYDQACRDISTLVADKTREMSIIFDAIAGGESRDWIFSFAVARKLIKPHTMLYKDGKTVGSPLNGREVIIVSDLNNEGSSLRDLWLPTIKRGLGYVKGIFFYVDRLEDGTEVIKQLGLTNDAVVSLNEYAWDYLQRINEVDQVTYKSLRERMENKDEWAKRMLRSNAGFEKFASLSRDPKTQEKAKKILLKGYPSLKRELAYRLKDQSRIELLTEEELNN